MCTTVDTTPCCSIEYAVLDGQITLMSSTDMNLEEILNSAFQTVVPELSKYITARYFLSLSKNR